MAIPSWTSLNIPQVPQRGYTESMGSLILRTPMDAGPAKLRYRGKKPDLLNVQFLMTTTEVATLDTFIKTTLNGVKRFNFTHPRTKQLVEVRIVPQQEGVLYNISYVAPEYWNVSLQFEILP